MSKFSQSDVLLRMKVSEDDWCLTQNMWHQSSSDNYMHYIHVQSMNFQTELWLWVLTLIRQGLYASNGYSFLFFRRTVLFKSFYLFNWYHSITVWYTHICLRLTIPQINSIELVRMVNAKNVWLVWFLTRVLRHAIIVYIA